LACSEPALEEKETTVRDVHLTLAMSDYDHVRDLTSGAIRAEGIELTYLNLSVEEIFWRFSKFREWDVSEMSMGQYASLVSQGDASITAIPVFPSRIFRHSAFYVRRDGPVKTPQDLVGRRVGIPQWSQTAGIYARGVLMHQYGIRLQEIDWYQAGVNETGREEPVALKLPAGVRFTQVPDKTLNGMLLAGELEAIITAHPPESVKQRHPDVAQLFPDILSVETAYWRATRIFPIMHTVVIRTDALASHRWIAMNLYRAFEEAKRRSVARALDIVAPRFPVPWVFEHAARARELFGEDFWPYGIEPNRPTLEAFLAFAHEQGVCHRPVSVDELFPEELRSVFKV
jgi:4,5-dihydroxyphthalate decarboxylase